MPRHGLPTLELLLDAAPAAAWPQLARPPRHPPRPATLARHSSAPADVEGRLEASGDRPPPSGRVRHGPRGPPRALPSTASRFACPLHDLLVCGERLTI